MARATATDSVQPISNAMYATLGLVPRMPLLSLVGLPRRPEAFGELPSGVVPLPFDELAAGSPDGVGHRMLVEAIDTLDRELLGAAHPADHRFLRSESRHGWLYRGPDGTPVGYGYAGEAGRVGPIAVRDEALLGPVLGTPDLGRPAARRLRHLGRRRGRSRGRAGSPGGLPARPVPRARLLGSPVRRFLPLPADLAGAAVGTPSVQGPSSRWLPRPSVRFAGVPDEW